MKKFFLTVCAFLGLLGLAEAACVNTGTGKWTTTPDYSSVSTCVSNAQSWGYGWTINVEQGDGSEDWAGEIYITKYGSLIGPGSSLLTITNLGHTDSRTSLIQFTPDSTSRSANSGNGGLFRVTGFKLRNTGHFNNNSSKGIHFLGNATFTSYYRNIVVDNCVFEYFDVYSNPPNLNDAAWYGSPIRFENGLWAGVIHSCQFLGWPDSSLAEAWYFSQLQIYIEGQDTTSWNVHSNQLGSVDAVYIEDCQWQYNGDWLDGGYGGNYVWRFNSVSDMTHTTTVIQPDSHGNRYIPYCVHYPTDQAKCTTGGRSMIQCETYCNKVDNERRNGTTTLNYYINAGGRGGYSATWGNRFLGSPADGYYRAGYFYDEDIARSDMWGNVPSHVSHNGTTYRCIQSHAGASNKEPGTPGGTAYWTTAVYSWGDAQTAWASDGPLYLDETDGCYDPIRSYVFENRVLSSSNLIPSYYLSTTCYPSVEDCTRRMSDYVQVDREIFTHKVPFTGASGVGSGTKAQMQGITSCDDGVGFWVTDEGSWNKSSGTNGLHNPLGYTGQGQLYKCNNNSWELYYTPYTYPHPLRMMIRSSSAGGATIRGGKLQ